MNGTPFQSTQPDHAVLKTPRSVSRIRRFQSDLRRHRSTPIYFGKFPRGMTGHVGQATASLVARLHARHTFFPAGGEHKRVQPLERRQSMLWPTLPSGQVSPAMTANRSAFSVGPSSSLVADPVIAPATVPYRSPHVPNAESRAADIPGRIPEHSTPLAVYTSRGGRFIPSIQIAPTSLREGERADLNFPLSRPPIPLASWLGVAPPALEHAEQEPITSDLHPATAIMRVPLSLSENAVLRTPMRNPMASTTVLWQPNPPRTLLSTRRVVPVRIPRAIPVMPRLTQIDPVERSNRLSRKTLLRPESGRPHGAGALRPVLPRSNDLAFRSIEATEPTQTVMGPPYPHPTSAAVDINALGRSLPAMVPSRLQMPRSHSTSAIVTEANSVEADRRDVFRAQMPERDMLAAWPYRIRLSPTIMTSPVTVHAPNPLSGAADEQQAYHPPTEAATRNLQSPPMEIPTHLQRLVRQEKTVLRSEDPGERQHPLEPFTRRHFAPSISLQRQNSLSALGLAQPDSHEQATNPRTSVRRYAPGIAFSARERLIQYGEEAESHARGNQPQPDSLVAGIASFLLPNRAESAVRSVHRTDVQQDGERSDRRAIHGRSLPEITASESTDSTLLRSRLLRKEIHRQRQSPPSATGDPMSLFAPDAPPEPPLFPGALLESREVRRKPTHLPMAVRRHENAAERPIAPPVERHAMAERAPERLYPIIGGETRVARHDNLLIQRSPMGSSPEAPPSNGTQSTASPDQDGGSADSGAAANEIQLLANEVWHLLKRRMAVDAERRGG